MFSFHGTWLGHRASTNQCGKFELTNCNAGHKIRYSTSWDWPSLVISSSFRVNDGKLEKWQTCTKSESQGGRQTGTTLPHLQALTYLHSCASWQFLVSASLLHLQGNPLLPPNSAKFVRISIEVEISWLDQGWWQALGLDTATSNGHGQVTHGVAGWCGLQNPLENRIVGNWIPSYNMLTY